MDPIAPGSFPFTSGIHPGMYRDQLWTMRQYAGFGSAFETNLRYRKLLAAGTSGLSVAFDLPTQLGYDSDHPLARGEVGRVGVAIDTVDDLAALFADIPLDQVSTSMTINAPAAVLLAMYEVLAEERGIAPTQLRGTVQNDVLKEYIARGNYVFPPAASMRLTADLIEYCAERLPLWNTISISGYHMAEAGATAVQELAFTFANAIAYVEAAQARGLAVDQFASRLAFFFVARTDLLGEVAKFRAARRIWAKLMRDRFGALEPRSQMLRFHTQTAGVELAAQQPEVNLVRVTLQALAAVLGGSQSLHTNGFDEALGLPTEHSATLALRTQQVLAYESGVADYPDPLGGSAVVEALTDAVEHETLGLLAEVERRGGAVAAIEAGYQRNEIEVSAYATARRLADGLQVQVGVNRFNDGSPVEIELHRMDPEVEAAQQLRLADARMQRNPQAVADALAALQADARSTVNLLPAIRTAVKARASLGEVCQVLRQEFGEYQAI